MNRIMPAGDELIGIILSLQEKQDGVFGVFYLYLFWWTLYYEYVILVLFGKLFCVLRGDCMLVLHPDRN